MALLVLKVSRATRRLGLEDLLVSLHGGGRRANMVKVPSRKCRSSLPPASWGGLDRLLTALRTLEERLSRSRNPWQRMVLPAARAKVTDASAFDHPGALQREEWSLLR